MVGEFVTFFAVLGYMIRHQVRRSSVLYVALIFITRLKVIHGNAVRSRSHSTGTRSRAQSINTTTVRVPANYAKTYQTVIIRICRSFFCHNV